MIIDFLINEFKQKNQKIAFIYKNNPFTYSWLISQISFYNNFIEEHNIKEGSIIAIDSDYTPYAVALLLSLIEKKMIIIPFTNSLNAKKDVYLTIAECQLILQLNNDTIECLTLSNNILQNNLLISLINIKHPGVILFSSGTTGKSKASLHDFNKLLNKYKSKRKDLKTIAFMFYDHIGGLDTVLYSLSNGSTIIILEERTPNEICQVIQDYQVEVLPTTPTFLNLLIISELYKNYNLSSLKYITYGTEVMPSYTLKKCKEIFPNVTLLQKYGTTEVGTLRSKSKNSESLWVKLGGEGYNLRIIEGELQIKADSAMMGYLNAPNPFTEDGWFKTGDLVEEDGEFIKFLGRKSETINVGGEKVYPAEVENIIQEFKNIAEVSVYGEVNAIIGNIVCATVTTIEPITNAKEFISEIKKYCQNRLERYKIPIKIFITQEEQHTDRFKKRKQNLL